MALDLVEQGSEPPGEGSRRRTAALALVAAGVVAAGALQVRVEDRADERTPQPSGTSLDRAEVRSVRSAPGGVLHLHVGLEGRPRARLQSLQVELPGSDVVLQRTPDRLTDDGDGLLAADVVPRCPSAASGLSRAAVTAVVRDGAGSPARRTRVPLDAAGPLQDAVRARCGTPGPRPRLRTSPVRLDPVQAGAAAGEPLRTRVEVSASEAGEVTLVAVRAGPGLASSLRTPLPLRLSPGQPPVPVDVDLRPGACGTPPDTPPYVLVLSSGDVVAPPVTRAVLPLLDDLRPVPCPG